jgi:flagellar assembly protein FliH
MQPETVKRFMIEAFAEVTTRRDQEFIPLLHAGSETKALKEAVCTPEVDPRQVFEEAYAEGEKAGFEMGMKKVDPLIERLNLYLAELESYECNLTQKAETLAFGLALAFSESIVLKECVEHQEALLRMIRKALELCEQKGKKVIRIRPEDSKFIEQQSTGWIIVADDTLKEPGFVIETDFGDVDGRVSIQLDELKREFLIATDNNSSPGRAEGESKASS